MKTTELDRIEKTVDSWSPEISVIVGGKKYPGMAAGAMLQFVTIYADVNGSWIIAGQWSQCAYNRIMKNGGVFKA